MLNELGRGGWHILRHSSKSLIAENLKEVAPKREKAMAPHSSTLAWKIPWTEEPGRLQSMVSLRVGQDWAASLSLFTFMHWRRKWQPTPVFLPGESQRQGAWWAAIYGVAQSRTWLKQLSSSSTIKSRYHQETTSCTHSKWDNQACVIQSHQHNSNGFQYAPSTYLLHLSMNVYVLISSTLLHQGTFIHYTLGEG